MRNFIVNLFSNRFGIILAAVNLCYFANKARIFSNHPLDIVFACANIPAWGATFLSIEFVGLLGPEISFSPKSLLIPMFAGLFVTLQWLFIAWIAQTLAQKFRPKEL
jgi:hypothetical protein